MVDCLRPFLKIACLKLPIQVFKEWIDRLDFSFIMCSRGGYEDEFSNWEQVLISIDYATVISNTHTHMSVKSKFCMHTHFYLSSGATVAQFRFGF